jgi:hypothetical protein
MRMDGRNVATIFERDVDISAQVGGHFSTLFSNDRNSVSSIGAQKEPSLEDDVIPQSRAFLPFERVIFREEEDAHCP